jgi:hypothetical protein
MAHFCDIQVKLSALLSGHVQTKTGSRMKLALERTLERKT